MRERLTQAIASAKLNGTTIWVALLIWIALTSPTTRWVIRLATCKRNAEYSLIADHWTIYWVKQFGLRLEPMYPRAGKLFREKGGQLLEGAEPTFLSSNEVHHLVMGDLPWNAQVSRYRQAIRLLKTTNASTVDSG